MTTHDFHEYDTSLVEIERKIRTENNFMGKSSSALEVYLSASSLFRIEWMRLLLNSAGRQAWLPLSALPFAV